MARNCDRAHNACEFERSLNNLQSPVPAPEPAPAGAAGPLTLRAVATVRRLYAPGADGSAIERAAGRAVAAIAGSSFVPPEAVLSAALGVCMRAAAPPRPSPLRRLVVPALGSREFVHELVRGVIDMMDADDLPFVRLAENGARMIGDRLVLLARPADLTHARCMLIAIYLFWPNVRPLFHADEDPVPEIFVAAAVDLFNQFAAAHAYFTPAALLLRLAEVLAAADAGDIA